MLRSIAAMCCGVVLGGALALFPQAEKKAPVAPPAEFLAVGQTYHFDPVEPPPFLGGEVVAKPRDNWVLVRFGRGDKPSLQWINLNHVARLVPMDRGRPAEKK
jgi:hypothetical protein